MTKLDNDELNLEDLDAVAGGTVGDVAKITSSLGGTTAVEGMLMIGGFILGLAAGAMNASKN